MNTIEDIYNAYRLVHEWIASDDARDIVHYPVNWERTDALNDHAYYVLLFGKLEDYITVEYKSRKDDEADFMHRVNVLLGKGSPLANMIDTYYGIRCDIAHGRLDAPSSSDISINMPKVFEDINKIFEALEVQDFF
jgi:hypothetical protein